MSPRKAENTRSVRVTAWVAITLLDFRSYRFFTKLPWYVEYRPILAPRCGAAMRQRTHPTGTNHRYGDAGDLMSRAQARLDGSLRGRPDTQTVRAPGGADADQCEGLCA